MSGTNVYKRQYEAIIIWLSSTFTLKQNVPTQKMCSVLNQCIFMGIVPRDDDDNFENRANKAGHKQTASLI